MMCAESLIAGARARAMEREGVRFKLRMSSDLKKKVAACAVACGAEFGEWVNLACLKMKRGLFDGVAWMPETLEATREGSEVVWVRAPKGLNAPQIRLAAACSVSVYYPKISATHEPFRCDLVEGKDYLVERSGD